MDECAKHAIAAKVFLADNDLASFTIALERCEAFNGAVYNSAKQLSLSIVHRDPEAFEDELESWRICCEGVVSTELLDSLSVIVHSSSVDIQPFAHAVVRAFLVGFCSYFVHQNGAQATLDSLPQFQSFLLKKLGALLKVAQWSIRGAENRALFQNTIPELFETLLALVRISGSTIVGKTLKVRFSASPTEENASPVVGTVSVGMDYHQPSDSANEKPVLEALGISGQDISDLLVGSIPVHLSASHYSPVGSVASLQQELEETKEKLQLAQQESQRCREGLIRYTDGIDHGRETGVPTRNIGAKYTEENLRIREENKRLKEELRKTKYSAQQSIDRLHRELNAANGNCRVYIRATRDLQQQVHRGQEAIKGLQHELSNVTRKHDDTNALSDTRGKELLGAQVFLTTADSVAISDLVQTVNALNEEIFLAAASVGEAIVRKQWEMSEEEAKKCYETTSRYLGPKLAEIVHAEAQKPDGEVNPLLVQVILHVLLTRFCVEKINVWAPNNPVLSDQLLTMYHQIWSKEEQAVSGRWRALTRGQLRPDVSDWGAEFAEMRTKVMMTAAWDVASEEQHRIIENQIAPVFKSVVDTRIALGEKFTSADIEIFIVEDGAEMDSRFMEEEYGNYGAEPSSEKRIVAATSRMGLKKPVQNTNGQLRYEIVLSPKVVIEASMKAILEPVQTTRTLRKKRCPI